MVRISKLIRIFGFVFVSCIAFAPNHLSAQQEDRCLEMRTQNEMNNCEAERYQKIDDDLNRVYKMVVMKYRSDPKFLAKLKLAQQAWLKFRDTDLDSIYYEENKIQAYGSVYPTCRAIVLTRLTVERTRELRQLLNPEEGDVCGFSAAEGKTQKPEPVGESSKQH